MIIRLKNVSYCWPGQQQPTLNIPSLEVEKGEHLFLHGPSGSGKTTLLNLLTGINTPQSGQLEILETDIAKLSESKRDRFRADHLGVIFQQFNLLPYLSVLDNVLLSCDFSKTRLEKAGNAVETAKQLLLDMEISGDLLHSKVSSLSMGQQQRVAVARALIGNPEVIIADEPTSALDTDNRDRFLDLLFTESDKHGSTLIFVSHDTQIQHRFNRMVSLATINNVDNASDNNQINHNQADAK
ncbi:ABC transporter ATP-binding protein [Cocleimonas flava]|uniref:Putative ABC transport system ATP-binding protein n=1 Tax=Cocleimonas flava TaxID=634765 RepID=A0A4V2P8B8_9GAMM|nr:ABC transporter ATP-binding protein [Cocleimonas flava]TCJ85175.1 putative ABC transport system ATP-binding protein [Cocleimonas flava]